jgi:hypothetical protein
MICIFCDKGNNAKSIEHIVPESLGNQDYIMPKHSVCDGCNTRFSKFEDKALTNTVLVMERARKGVVTKKGNNVKGRVNELTIEGNENFEKNIIVVQGLNSENFTEDPQTKRGQLFIKSFDKSEVATSKFLLKIGLESIYKSRKDILRKYDFTDLKNFLVLKSNVNWPFVTTDYETSKFESVPRFTDKYKLNQIHCQLKYLEVDMEILLFKFKYGDIPMTINLLNRNLKWVREICAKDELAMLYPEHYRNKL